MTREYWFEIPPLFSEPTRQVCIRASNSMQMLAKLKEHFRWQDALFLGYGIVLHRPRPWTKNAYQKKEKLNETVSRIAGNRAKSTPKKRIVHK